VDLDNKQFFENKYNKFCELASELRNLFLPQEEIREGKNMLTEISETNCAPNLGLLHRKK